MCVDKICVKLRRIEAYYRDNHPAVEVSPNGLFIYV